MKLSQLFHVISVVVGAIGIGTLVAAAIAGQVGLVFGFTREHLLFCSIIVFLVAIWIQLASIHHVMLEREDRIV